MLVRHPFQHVYLGISSHFLTNSSDMGTDSDIRIQVPSFEFRENKKAEKAKIQWFEQPSIRGTAQPKSQKMRSWENEKNLRIWELPP